MTSTFRTFAIRILLALTMVFVLAAAGVQTARAMEIDEDGQVSEGEVVNDDLVLTQNSVSMAGTVNGNLIAMGSDVVIAGTVNGDVIAFGSTVTVSGTVNGNVFIGSGEAVFEGQTTGSLFFGGNNATLGETARVGSNLYAAGFSISLLSGSVVERDAAVAGYQAILAGEIKRDLHANVGAFELSGKIGRNVTLDVGEPEKDSEDVTFLYFMPFSRTGRIVPAGMNITSEAVIGGKLEYYSAVDQSTAIQATPEGGVVYHYRAPTDSSELETVKTNVQVHVIDYSGIFMNYVFGVIREFLTLVLLGALAVWLIPSVLNRAAGALRTKPLPSLGWGLIVLVAGLMALLIGCLVILMLGLAIGVVTLFGLMSVVFGIGFSAIGLAGAVFLAVAQYGSKLVVALLIGDLILRLFRKDYSASSFWPLLLGILLMVFVDAVPVLGTLVGFLVCLFGLGAIWLVLREVWQARSVKA